MPTKKKTDDAIRIPVVLKDAEDARIALALKHSVEKRDGRDISWAGLVRLAFRAMAKSEGVK